MKTLSLKPVVSEKAVMLIEMKNTLVFEADKRLTKTQLKENIEEIFGVKVKSVNTHIQRNKKLVYATLQQSHPAIDVATKLGLI